MTTSTRKSPAGNATAGNSVADVCGGTRFFAAGFFALFSYVELIEKSCYLNHYYFVSIVSFLLILLILIPY